MASASIAILAPPLPQTLKLLGCRRNEVRSSLNPRECFPILKKLYDSRHFPKLGRDASGHCRSVLKCLMDAKAHVHDIFLPFAYSRLWMDRHYSEQYLLAAYLLAGYSRFEVLLPLAYISQHPVTGAFVNKTWGQPLFQRAFSRNRQNTGGYIGTSFWLKLK